MRGLAGVDERTPSQVGWVRWASRNPDLVVLGAWWILVAAFGFARRDFTGDGIRHLPAILDPARTHPALGEPRWLLFPALLYVLLRPLVALGLAHDVEALTRPMMAATLLTAGIYLLGIRRCLVALGITPGRRAVALAVAGSSAGLFFAASDLMEPIFGATLAVLGLAFVAARTTDPQATEDSRRRAVLVGVAVIAAASFLYQGVILGVGLIPLFTPRATLTHRRTLIPAALILAAVPAVSGAILGLAGNEAARAFSRITQGEENPLYRSYLKKSGPSAYLVALLGGPPQGLIALSHFQGFNGLIAALRGPGPRGEALAVVTRLGLGFAVVLSGVVAAVRRRDVTLLFGFAVLLLLPLVRHQQYGYVKYYVLLPVLLAVGAARAPMSVAAGVALILLVANGSTLLGTVRAGRQLYAERAGAYQQADRLTCWLSASWGPSIGFLWPGSVTAVLGSLASGGGSDPAKVVADAHATMSRSLEDCFCHSSSVFTDDMVEGSAGVVADLAEHFDYTEIDLPKLIVPAARARLVSNRGPMPVYAYASEDQKRLCSLVTAATAAAPK
jgi:hypothetical protein